MSIIRRSKEAQATSISSQTLITKAEQMSRQHIPAETKSRIKDLIRRGEPVSVIHNRFSGISLSTIKRYRAEVKAEHENDHDNDQ